MSSNECEVLAAAVDALARLEPTELTVSQLQDLTAGLVPQFGRLTGIQSRLVGELTARSGGTVPSAPARTAHPDRRSRSGTGCGS
jgi:hypothetical protein